MDKETADERKSADDDELSRIFDEVNGDDDDNGAQAGDDPDKGKTAEGPVAGDERPSHQESSRLGRKLKGLEDKLEQVMRGLESQESQRPMAGPGSEDAELDDIRETFRADPVAGQEKLDSWKARRASEAKKSYETQYLKTMMELKGPDESLNDEIIALMTSDDPAYNKVIFGYAAADARINYEKAKAAVSIGRATGKKVNVRAGQPASPSGGGNSVERKGTSTLPNLDHDPATKDYVDYLRRKGKSDEWLAQRIAK